MKKLTAAMLFGMLIAAAGFAAAAIGSHGRLFSMLTGTTSTTMTSTTPGQRRVTICHKTGSRKHPWHTITVAQPAVAAHLRHRDYLGACTTAPVTTASTTTSTNPVVHGNSAKSDSDSGSNGPGHSEDAHGNSNQSGSAHGHGHDD